MPNADLKDGLSQIMPAAKPMRPFDDPAQQAAGLLLRLGIAIIAIGAPLGSVFSRRLIFSLVPVGAVLILLAILLDPQRRQMERLREVLAAPAALTAVFVLGWAGLSLLWTPFTEPAAERYFKSASTLLLAAAAAAVLPSHTKTSNLYLLPAGLGASALAVLAFGLLHSPVPAQEIETSTLDRAALSLSMLLWPALGALAVRNRWASAGALAVAVAVAIIAVWTPVALVALALGAITFSLATNMPKKVGTFLGLLLAAVMMLAPAIPLALAPLLTSSTSAFALSIQIAEQIVTQDIWRLITGHGIDTIARSMGIQYLPAETPRTMIFEIWYEYGIVGAWSIALLIFLCCRGAAHLPAPISAFLLGGLVCGTTIVLCGLVTTQLWWLTLLAVVGVQFALVAKGQYRSVRPKAKAISAGSLPS